MALALLPGSALTHFTSSLTLLMYLPLHGSHPLRSQLLSSSTSMEIPESTTWPLLLVREEILLPSSGKAIEPKSFPGPGRDRLVPNGALDIF